MPNETTTDPYTVVATALKSIIDTEFAAEGITAIHDQLHEALGLNRVTVGIAPTSKYRGPNNNVVNLIAVEIRFYDLWDKEVDPEQTVNPMKITAYANRLERALQQSQAAPRFGTSIGSARTSQTTPRETRLASTCRFRLMVTTPAW
jgi:hypothetical protein